MKDNENSYSDEEFEILWKTLEEKHKTEGYEGVSSILKEIYSYDEDQKNTIIKKLLYRIIEIEESSQIVDEVQDMLEQLEDYSNIE